MMTDDFRAMGTTISASVDDPADAAACRQWFEQVEAVCSRFRPDSELSRLNADPRERVPVGALLGSILRAASEAAAASGGLVSPALGADLVRWGYDRTFDDVGDLAAPGTAHRHSPSWSIDDDVVLRGPGVRLDLGGFAKGWAADRALAMGLARIVSAGGDVASAHPDAEVDVTGLDNDILATVSLGCGGLATSSTLKRTWRVGDRTVSHLMNPRTGEPVSSPVLSATAVTSSALDAEVAAKTIVLRGADGLSWASAQPWVRSALVLWHDGSVFATAGLELAA